VAVTASEQPRALCGAARIACRPLAAVGAALVSFGRAAVSARLVAARRPHLPACMAGLGSREWYLLPVPLL